MLNKTQSPRGEDGELTEKEKEGKVDDLGTDPSIYKKNVNILFNGHKSLAKEEKTAP